MAAVQLGMMGCRAHHGNIHERQEQSSHWLAWCCASGRMFCEGSRAGGAGVHTRGTTGERGCGTVWQSWHDRVSDGVGAGQGVGGVTS